MIHNQEVLDIVTALTAAGGKPYLVGGSVREMVMGIDKPKDIDLEVYGLPVEKLVGILKHFGKVDQVGAHFGVIILKTRSNDYDVSVPRRESKSGNGHKGFIPEPDPTMTPEEASLRRDFTINSLFYDFKEKRIIDYHGAIQDIKNRILRHVSPAFSEDPLRVLRGMQFASRFDMTVAPETAKLCESLIKEYKYLPKERVWNEWEKWATRSRKPSMGLQFLRDTGWIKLYPELEAMIDVPQHPDWHPEGWSITDLSISNQSNSAGPTVTSGSNLIGSSRDFSIFPFTRKAVLEPFFRAASAKPIVNFNASSIFGTLEARANSFDLASAFGPTTITKTKSFVLSFGIPTVSTFKTVRIVLPVSLPSVFGIVNGTINDLKVFKEVVGPVAVLMMNMILPSESSPQVQFHNETVNIDPSTITGICDAFVSSAVIFELTGNSVDDNMFVAFDINIANSDFVHDSFNKDWIIADINTSIPEKTYLVKQGDVYTHVCVHVIDYMASMAKEMPTEDKAMLMFAALCHDLGKPSTTEYKRDSKETPGTEAWRSHGHAEAGVELTETFLTKIGCLRSIIDKVKPLVKFHLVHGNKDMNKRSVRRLANKLHPANIQELCWLIEADASGRPPKPVGLPAAAKKLLDLSQELEITLDKPKPILMGRDLLREKIVKAGPAMGKLIKESFEAQLDGVFEDAEGALEWARERIASY